MEIRIESESDVPIRHQLTEQIVFLIATETLKAGQPLPSVRELARRLKIHHNTVSDAYQDLVKRKWVVRRRGSRLVVAPSETLTPPAKAQTLDDLINATIRAARAMGYSLQALRERVRERLLTEPPDHIIVVEQDPGLREIMCDELRTALPWQVEGCSREELQTNRGLAIGALAVTLGHAIADVDLLFPKERPVIPVSFTAADEQLNMIRNLRQPSAIAVVSTSDLFLKMARSILAPAIGQRHTLREVLLSHENPSVARAADVVFCDSIAKRHIRSSKVIHYRVLAPESLDYVSTAMKSYQSG